MNHRREQQPHDAIEEPVVHEASFQTCRIAPPALYVGLIAYRLTLRANSNACRLREWNLIKVRRASAKKSSGEPANWCS